KIICEKDSGKILGAHIAGAHATDLIAEAALAIQKVLLLLMLPIPSMLTRPSLKVFMSVVKRGFAAVNSDVLYHPEHTWVLINDDNTAV
ncbi:hypothetical protein ADUPG1_003787, partial [Aduncisulcus paluster]